MYHKNLQHQRLTLLDHAELSTELARMRTLLGSWLCHEGVLCDVFQKNAPAMRLVRQIDALIDKLRCELDDAWCADLQTMEIAENIFPYYSPTGRAALRVVTKYQGPRRPMYLPTAEQVSGSEVKRIAADLLAASAKLPVCTRRNARCDYPSPFRRGTIHTDAVT